MPWYRDVFYHHLAQTRNPRKLASPTHQAQDAPSCRSLFKMRSPVCGFLLRIRATLMYNLRRLSCNPKKTISDRKEMRPFQTKLNVSPQTGARTEVGLFSLDLCGQTLGAKPPSWHLKHVFAKASLVLFSLPQALAENLWASLNVTLSASLVPRWHKNRARSECKEGPHWKAIAQSELPFFRLTLICCNCQTKQLISNRASQRDGWAMH